MKGSVNFFGTTKKKSRVKCHLDGISISGVGSLRLSNIPKNLCSVGNLLLTMGKKAHSIFFYSFALSVVNTKADDCTLYETIGKTAYVYLNNSQKNAFLWIQYNAVFYAWNAINNTCNFTLADKQPGSYEQLDCLCPIGSDRKIKLYGQNITLESIQCIEGFLNRNCDKLTTGQTIAIIVLTPVAASFLLYCISPCIILLNKRKPEQDLPSLYPEEQLEIEEEPEKSCLRRLCC